jgi:hypothetical protein
MAPSEAREETLRRLLVDRTSAAVEKAVTSGGEIAEDDVAALGRLARLVELRKAAEPQQPRQLWPLLVLGGSTLLVASVLLFARVTETEVELEIGATEVSFSLLGQQVLFENMSLSSLLASGLRRVTLPEVDDGEPGEATPDEDASVRLEAVQDGTRRGAIGIAAIVPGAGTDVWIRRADVPGQYRLSIRNATDPIQVDIEGLVNIAASGLRSRTVDLKNPRAIVLEPSREIVDLDLTFVDAAGAAMTPQVPIEHLAMRRVDEFGDRGRSIVRTISTIVSGTLFFESLNGLQRPLRSGEALRFERSSGEMRTVRLEPSHLTMSFHGRVRGMKTGSDESQQNLMPTWLDWLRARHGLSLLWGTSVYLFGIGTAVVRWFKAA